MSQHNAYIFEVSEHNFDQLILENSHKLPVFVEFMDPSIGTCIAMERVLASLAKTYSGQFIFATLDVSMYPDMSKRFDVNNVPSLLIFNGGLLSRTEVGLMEEAELVALLREYGVYKESDDMRAQAREKHLAGDTAAAIQLLTEAIQKDPGNTLVAMDMIQVMLDVDFLDQAVALFNKLPNADKESDTGRSLTGQITFKQLAAKTEGKTALLERLSHNLHDHDARFDLALCLVAEHNYPQAMENLFEVLVEEPEYKQGAAQEMIVSLINMLEPNEPEMAQAFRRRLGSMLS